MPERAKILLADDDDVSRDAVARELRAAGYGVEEASGTDELMSRVARGGIDLVLLDATMQGPRGLEACRTLKGMTHDLFLPIVLFAVRTDPESRVQALLGGADECVDKPILVDELRRVIDRQVEVKRLAHEADRAKARLTEARMRDPLTGAAAYGLVRAKLKDELARAEVQHEPLACCLLDVDHLRLENERLRTRLW